MSTAEFGAYRASGQPFLATPIVQELLVPLVLALLALWLAGLIGCRG